MKSRCVEFALAAKTACLHARSPNGLSMRHRIALSIVALRHKEIDQSARDAVANFLEGCTCSSFRSHLAAEIFERFMMAWEALNIPYDDSELPGRVSVPEPSKSPVAKTSSVSKPKQEGAKDERPQPDLSWLDRADLQ